MFRIVSLGLVQSLFTTASNNAQPCTEGSLACLILMHTMTTEHNDAFALSHRVNTACRGVSLRTRTNGRTTQNHLVAHHRARLSHRATMTTGMILRTHGARRYERAAPKNAAIR